MGWVIALLLVSIALPSQLGPVCPWVGGTGGAGCRLWGHGPALLYSHVRVHRYLCSSLHVLRCLHSSTVRTYLGKTSTYEWTTYTLGWAS